MSEDIKNTVLSATLENIYTGLSGLTAVASRQITKLNTEIETRAADDLVISGALTGLTTDVSTLSTNFTTFKTNVETGVITLTSISKTLNEALTGEVKAREDADEFLSGKIDTLNGNDTTEGSVAKAVKDASDALSAKIGEGFDSTNTVKKAIEDASKTAAYDANVSGKAGEAITVDYTSAYYNTTSNTGLSEQFTVGLKLASGEKVLSQSADGLTTTIGLAKVATEAGYAATYELQGIGGAKLGASINIPQDQMLSGVTFVDGEGAGDDKLQFVFYVTDEEGTTTTTQTVDVPLSGLFNEYTGVSGVVIEKNAANNGFNIKGKVDATSETFLTVGEDGFKLAGVQTAIDAAAGVVHDELFAASTLLQGQIDALETYVSGAAGLKSQIDANAANIDDLSTAIDTNNTNRIADINALSAAITGITSDYATKEELADETSARIDADDAIRTEINQKDADLAALSSKFASLVTQIEQL